MWTLLAVASSAGAGATIVRWPAGAAPTLACRLARARSRPLSSSAAGDAGSARRTTLRALPDFKGPSRLLKLALKGTKEVAPSAKIKSPKKRAVNFAVRRIDAMSTGLSIPLREQVVDPT